MHFRIALAFVVLGRTGCVDDGSVDNGTLTQRQVLVLQVIVDGVQNARRQVALLQQVSEIHYRRVFRDRNAERQTSKLAHRSDFVQPFFHGRVAQREPALPQMNAQHGFQWVRLMATASIWGVPFDQRHQPAPRNHLLHLGKETLATGLLAFTGVLKIGETHLTYGMAGLLGAVERRAISAQVGWPALT